MLIKKAVGGNRQSPAPSPGATAARGSGRMETLLISLEKNLELEAFFIGRKEVENLLELLPAQGDILRALRELYQKIPQESQEALEIDRRLALAAESRQRNQKLLDECICAAKTELEDLNSARRRLQQMKALSKNIYADPEPSKLENWA